MFFLAALTDSKSLSNLQCAESLARVGRRAVGAAVLAILALNGLPYVGAVVVTDDFSDGNDTTNPTWVHLDGAVATTGQTWDASSGAYRLHSPTLETGGSEADDVAGYDFVGSYVPTSFTDVRVTVDIVDFVNPGFQSSFFAVAARLNGDNDVPTEEKGLALRGYSYQYEGTAASGDGEMVLSIFHGNGIKDIGSFPLTLNNANDYRIIFEVIGNTLHGQVFELAGGVPVGDPLADQFRDLDANPPNADTYDGPLNPERDFVPYESGFAGVYGVGHVFFTDPDFTIDNFRAESIGGSLPGDFDGDGDVDSDDFSMWEGSFGVEGGLNGADFLAWQQNRGATSSTAAVAAVPEPGTVALGWLAASMSALATRRRKLSS